MFTGLVENVGEVAAITPIGGERALIIRTALGAELLPGDSVAVNGICLTVTSRESDSFTAHVSPATLSVTTLGGFRVGRRVNLERPLRADSRVGGHFVLGHVDAVGRIASLKPDGESYLLEVDTPASIEQWLVEKGSIAVDGISLTVAGLTERRIRLQIVPFTWTHTALADAREGDHVNLEADIIGKYVARLAELRGLAALDPAAIRVSDL
jgi:riboflavin synthase